MTDIATDRPKGARKKFLPDMAGTNNAPAGNATNARVSQAPGEWIVRSGGIGILPRRGFSAVDVARLQTMEGVEWLTRYKPLDALIMLSGVIPELDSARSTFLRLGITEGSARLRAMQKGPDGKKKENAESTAKIDALFDSLPAEAGGFTGCLEQTMQMVLFTGMAIVEAIPADDGNGLKEVWPQDTPTCFFVREKDLTLGLYQRQIGIPKDTSKPLLGVNAQFNMQRTFWDSLDRLPSNPYGQGTFSTALNEIIRNERFLFALDRAWHRVGLPKYDIEFDFEMWAQIAERIVPNLTDEDLYSWIMSKYEDAQDKFRKQNPDDAFWHAKGTKVNVTGQAGSWPDVPGIYAMRRWRLVIALHMLPTLMGINDGATETWSVTEWRAWTACLRSVVECGCSPLVKAAQLHLQLLGDPCTVELDYTPVASGQRLADAQAEQIELENAATKEDRGYITHDEASMETTGSAAVGPAKADAYIQQGLNPDGTQPKVLPVNPAGNPPNGDKQANNKDRAGEKPKNSSAVLLQLFQDTGIIEDKYKPLITEFEAYAARNAYHAENRARRQHYEREGIPETEPDNDGEEDE